jgi:HSF-type DNA-binding
MSKLALFQRQLYLYGFQRLTRGRDRGCYYHECFLRGRVDLARDMHRVVVKGTVIKAATNPDQEPNLYSLPTLPTELSRENDTNGSQSDFTVEELIDQVDHSFELQLTSIKAPLDSMDMSSSLVTFDQDGLEWTDFLVADHDVAFNCRPIDQIDPEDASIDAGMILDFCSDCVPTALNL